MLYLPTRLRDPFEAPLYFPLASGAAARHRLPSSLLSPDGAAAPLARRRLDAGGAEGVGGEGVGGVRAGVEGAVGAGRPVAASRPVGSGRLGQFADDAGV